MCDRYGQKFLILLLLFFFSSLSSKFEIQLVEFLSIFFFFPPEKLPELSKSQTHEIVLHVLSAVMFVGSDAPEGKIWAGNLKKNKNLKPILWKCRRVPDRW